MMRLVFSLIFLWISTHSFAQEKSFTLEEIFKSRKLLPRFVQGFNWFSGTTYAAIEADEATKTVSIVLVNALSGEKEVLARSEDLKFLGRPIDFAHFEISSDKEHILLTGALPARRLKTGGEVYLYSRKTNLVTKLSRIKGDYEIVKLSPDGKKVGYVRNKNLFVYDIATGRETQLTRDGNANILNGVFDWVYEEEFSIIDGWQWSPDSKHIAFWRLDQSQVPEFKITQYDSLYLSFLEYRYPKAGDKNSLVKIGVVSVDSRRPQPVFIDLAENTDIYIPRLDWLPDSKRLAYQRLNRQQNVLELFFYDLEQKSSRLVLTERSDAWVEVENNGYYFLKNSDAFIWSSDRDGYQHFYLYGYDGVLKAQLTRGDFDDDALLYVDEPNQTLYFTSAKDSPLERHLYSVKFDGSQMQKLTSEPGTHSAEFSPDGSLYYHTYSSVSTPPKFYLRKKDGSLVRELENNAALEKTLSEYRMGKAQFLTFKNASGVELNAWLLVPADFDSTKKYPVLMHVYGGPGSQTVRNAWGAINLWYHYLTQQGYLVFSVDNRGTGFRGAAFKKLTYKKLGIAETEDQVSGAKFLASLAFVDKSRIGIYGWSYGGYMASMCMTYGNSLAEQVFKAGIAGAPVTHWKFYDTIYTERYMDTPQRNPKGYEISAPLTYADRLKGNFLLIHGTLDDNVHFQNSTALAKKLQELGKPFQAMFYPEQYHGIRGPARFHLHQLMTQFILEKL
ncbi:MAG: S9 family peptidase [[Chlorobium] sp. 445]|nr:MAG: S9 family peptidase [[Chlorobium] sp. 445]